MRIYTDWAGIASERTVTDRAEHLLDALDHHGVTAVTGYNPFIGRGRWQSEPAAFVIAERIVDGGGYQPLKDLIQDVLGGPTVSARRDAVAYLLNHLGIEEA